MKKTHESSRRNILGRHIRAARFAAKPAVSQEDLAGRLAILGVNLDQGAISRIENEQRYLMDYELIAIARALRIPTWTLLLSSEARRRSKRPLEEKLRSRLAVLCAQELAASDIAAVLLSLSRRAPEKPKQKPKRKP